MSTTFNVSEIEQNVHLLDFDNGKKLYLVGTAHVSQQSTELVSRMINEIKPDTICIELDEQRHKAMTQKSQYEDIDIIEIIKKGQLFFFIGQFLLASYQKKISEKTGSKPGTEFQKANELAVETGARLVLADRNIGVTLKRAWRLTTLGRKFKTFFSLLFAEDDKLAEQDIEALKQSDAIDEMINAFAKELPDAKRVLIDERDIYLSHSIQKNLGTVTVAVVGAGHIPGILTNLKRDIPDSERDQISVIPEATAFEKIMPWIIPGLIVAVFVAGFFFGNREMAGEVAIYWILVTGILAALGSLLALAHPLTIIAGFIGAPITTLNPAVGVGIVTAFVQTLVCKPRVRDFEQIQEGALKLTDWWKNRLTKIFLVFILSSIGASIGTFVGLPALLKFFNL